MKFKEILDDFMNGKKIFPSRWLGYFPKGSRYYWFERKNNTIYNEKNEVINFHGFYLNDDWLVFEEPERLHDAKVDDIKKIINGIRRSENLCIAAANPSFAIILSDIIEELLKSIGKTRE